MTRLRWAIIGVPLLAGAVCVVVSRPWQTVFGIGWGLIGVAMVAGVSMVFLLIGESEDRERERDRQRRG